MHPSLLMVLLNSLSKLLGQLLFIPFFLVWLFLPWTMPIGWMYMFLCMTVGPSAVPIRLCEYDSLLHLRVLYLQKFYPAALYCVHLSISPCTWCSGGQISPNAPECFILYRYPQTCCKLMDCFGGATGWVLERSMTRSNDGCAGYYVGEGRWKHRTQWATCAQMQPDIVDAFK